jgi:hypothetical protein
MDKNKNKKKLYLDYSARIGLCYLSKGDIDRVVFSTFSTDLVHVTGSREKVVAVLVE